jgi:hypothetical protein
LTSCFDNTPAKFKKECTHQKPESSETCELCDNRPSVYFKWADTRFCREYVNTLNYLSKSPTFHGDQFCNLDSYVLVGLTSDQQLIWNEMVMLPLAKLACPNESWRIMMIFAQIKVVSTNHDSFSSTNSEANAGKGIMISEPKSDRATHPVKVFDLNDWSQLLCANKATMIHNYLMGKQSEAIDIELKLY